jgi:hypothetical protein
MLENLPKYNNHTKDRSFSCKKEQDNDNKAITVKVARDLEDYMQVAAIRSAVF